VHGLDLDAVALVGVATGVGGLHVEVPVQLAVVGSVVREGVFGESDLEVDRHPGRKVAGVERAGGDARRDGRIAVLSLFVVFEQDFKGARVATLEDEDISPDRVPRRIALVVELELKPNAHGSTEIS